MMIKLAMIQMLVRPGEKAENQRQALALVEQAGAAGAQVAVLPEALPLGWTHPSARTEAEAVPGGPFFEALREAARAQRLYLCSGLVERAGDQIFNAAVLFSPAGELLLHHRKINELDIAHDLYALGDRLGVVRTPLGVMGVMVCADAFASGQVLSRALALMGADLILSPCAWAVPADDDSQSQPYGQVWLEQYGPVAREYGLWIAGVSNVGPITAGPWAGRRCIGCSLLMGPDGQPVVWGPYGEDAEAILLEDVEIQPRPRPWFEPASEKGEKGRN